MNGLMHIVQLLNDNIELLAQPLPPPTRAPDLPALSYDQRMAWLQTLRRSFAAQPYSSYALVRVPGKRK
jgi:hypothetical protein